MEDQQLDNNNSTCGDLSDDHWVKTSSTEEAMGDTVGLERNAADFGRGAQRRCNSSATKHLTTSAALKEEDSIIMEDDTTDSHQGESHDCPARPPANEAYPTRISNHVAGLSNQSGEDDDGSNGGNAIHENHHDADHSHDEAYQDANNTNKFGGHDQELGGTSIIFPQRLMDVIEQSQHDEPNILEWVNGGGAFLIRDKEAFEQSILVPKYFNWGRNNCKFFTSFVRKLYRQVCFPTSLHLHC
jgi:hypothetical protein